MKYTTELQNCQHIYLRGNHKDEMFFDHEDLINVWNRLWLAAAATKTQILAAEFLNNHFHLTVLLTRKKQESDFMHYFRMSITQYYNRRYQTHGVLGTRDFNRAQFKDLDDLKDCICYNLRNVLHHYIQKDFMNYPFSTAKFIYSLQDSQPAYTRENLSRYLSRKYLPARAILPKGWTMTDDCMIIPPEGVFRRDILESLFENEETYLDTLSRRTRREIDDLDIPATELRNSPTRDEKIVEYISENCQIPIPSMTTEQKMDAIFHIIDHFRKSINLTLLSRVFSIPYSTLRHRIGNWQKRN